jgi:predicted choloylglycine hydrolase
MPSVPQLDVDLNASPERRWDELSTWRDVARELLAFYLRDIGGLDKFAPLLREYRDAFVDAEYVAEMRGVARAIGAPEEEVALANLYYDAIKVVLSGGIGCTAFAVDADAGPLHARNLDWTTAEGRLASETIIFNFRRGGSEPLYRTVGWPGFIGCLSGVAMGRFAVTLNAVISNDPPELAPPITFVLRRALETCKTFDEATAMLRDARVASDSLLLVSGPNAGQMAVIERAPTRAAVRLPDAGAVFVTNDYRALLATERETMSQNALVRTACSRYDRAQELVRGAPPRDPEACLRVLADPQVKMGITVQHMVLSAATGGVHVALPS